MAAGQTSLASFDAVILRSMPGGSLEQIVFRMDALAELERMGVAVINPARAVEACVDKYLTLVLLQKAGLPVPRTWHGQTAADAMEAWTELGGRAVLKPLFGSEGRGLMLVDHADLAERVFDWLARNAQTIYLQEFIDHGNSDLRLFVAGDEVVAMRRSSSHDWRLNAARGAQTAAVDPDAGERALAIAAARAVGAVVAGVDVVRDPSGQLLILEVNSAPGWKHLAAATGADIGRMVVAAVETAVRKICPRVAEPG